MLTLHKTRAKIEESGPTPKIAEVLAKHPGKP